MLGEQLLVLLVDDVEVPGVKGESPLLLIPKTLTKDDRDDKWGMG